MVATPGGLDRSGPSRARRSISSSSLRAAGGRDSVEADVLEINRKTFDPPDWRRDPVGEFAGLDHAPHQGFDEGMIGGAGEPRVLLAVPGGFRQHFAVAAGVVAGEIPELAVEAQVGQGGSELESEALPHAV